MALEILTGEDNKTLRTKSEFVSSIDSKTKKFIKEMEKKMMEADGVGLAAPQVGLNKRIIVTRLNPGTKEEMIIPMVNPEILEASEETAVDEEGCLSIPDVWGEVQRPRAIVVTFKTPRNVPQTLRLQDLNARIVLHEVDHIDGILFIDRAKNVREKTADETAKDFQI